MSILKWPPEKTIKYIFDNELTMEIPAIDDEDRKKARPEDEGRG